jgi:hypothetical protein
MARNGTSLALALLLGTAAACGGGDKSPSGQASCNLASSFFCMDLYTVLPGDDTSCTNLGGTWSTTTACPAANLVGTCTVTSGGQTAAIRFYPSWTDSTAGSACASFTPPGTYTP